MAEPEQIIPFDRLPERFARRVEDPPEEAAEPRPAATVVLARHGNPDLEILLLRRTRSAGFVPGAYVFPGGRVDGDDADATTLRRTDGLNADAAAERLELPDADPPAIAYFLAALRETFEETGLLIAHGPDGRPAPAPAEDPRVLELREALLEEEISFGEVLEELDLRIDGASLEYIAHWITPKAEPRRYDTRFFMARVPGNRKEVVAPDEISTSLWIAPSEALDRHARGELPMVFPTLKTIEMLKPFSSPSEALADFAGRAIPSILPELVRTPTGIGIRVPEDEGSASSDATSSTP